MLTIYNTILLTLIYDNREPNLGLFPVHVDDTITATVTLLLTHSFNLLKFPSFAQRLDASIKQAMARRVPKNDNRNWT